MISIKNNYAKRIVKREADTHSVVQAASSAVNYVDGRGTVVATNRPIADVLLHTQCGHALHGT